VVQSGHDKEQIMSAKRDYSGTVLVPAVLILGLALASLSLNAAAKV
jgi:hypothetical protein